jgi:hypothetical protein
MTELFFSLIGGAITVVLSVMAWFLRRLVQESDETRRCVTKFAADIAVLFSKAEEADGRLDSHSGRLRDCERYIFTLDERSKR